MHLGAGAIRKSQEASAYCSCFENCRCFVRGLTYSELKSHGSSRIGLNALCAVWRTLPRNPPRE
eukprot:713988-Amphidinium_carterae.1